MALEFTLIDSWDDGKRLHLTGTVAASGSYSNGGDALDLSRYLTDIEVPLRGTAWMDGISGYDYVFVPGQAASDGKVKIYMHSSSAYPELAPGPYCGIAEDTITFYGIFRRSTHAQ